MRGQGTLEMGQQYFWTVYADNAYLNRLVGEESVMNAVQRNANTLMHSCRSTSRHVSRRDC